jgi:hypothetical protein
MVPVKKILVLLLVAFMASLTVGCSDDKGKPNTPAKTTNK